MGPRLAFILLLLLCLCDDARASEATIDSLSSRIDSLRAAGDYDAALVDARELLRHRVGARGFERERASRLVATLATIAAFSPEQRREMAEVDRLQSKIDDAGGRGAFAEAEGYARTQLEQRLRLLGDRHLESAESRNELAVVLQAQGRYVESERLCREALSIIREALGEESPEVTAALTNLGLVERGLGNFAAAEDCFRSALEIDRRLNGPVHPDVAVSQSNYAALLMARGRNAEAEAGFREVLRIRREVLGPEHPQIALTLNNLAVSLLNQGDYAAAEPLYRDALAIRRQALGPDHPDVASSLHNLAYLLQVQGDHAGAERLYREALAVWQRAFGADHPAIAKCLTNLANVLLLESQFAEAEESYDAALAMYRRLVGEAHPDIATCLHNLGRLHRLRGDPAGATALFDQALVMRRALLGEAHPDVAATELEIGLAAAARGDTTAAMASCRAALTLARELLGPAHPSVVQASSALGQLLRARRALPQAEQELNAAARAFEAARLRAGSGLARTTFLESPYPHLAALRLERGEGNAAWQAAELAQGRSLADLLLSAHRRDLSAAEAAAQDSVLGLLTPLESQVAQLERTPRAERSTEAQERLSLARSRLLNAEAGWAELQAAIARAHPITEGRSFELARIQASLEPGSAILGWVDDAPLLGQAERWGYVIRKRGAVHWARLPDPSGAAGFANPSSGDLRAEIARAGASSLGAPSVSAPSSLARALCRERVEPLLPFLDQVEELIVIPSGPMLGVPLDALSDEKGTMLGDRYSISYAPSATVFAWLREMPERARALSAAPALLLGDPATPAPASPDAPPRLSADAASVFGASGAFAASAVRGDVDSLSTLPRLIWSRDEVERIAKLFPASEVLLGEQASEEELKRHASSLRRYRVIHLATHALVDDDDPARSAVVLSQVGRADPLLAAADGRIVDDGLVSAREIVREWRLDADLVALSACQTALGRRVAGEGYIGLAHAFLQAGARALLVSLWNVNDEATALLMRRFYENWLGVAREGETLPRAPMSKSRALSDAKRWLRDYIDADGRRPFAHPFYWAPFILIGEPD